MTSFSSVHFLLVFFFVLAFTRGVFTGTGFPVVHTHDALTFGRAPDPFRGVEGDGDGDGLAARVRQFPFVSFSLYFESDVFS